MKLYFRNIDLIKIFNHFFFVVMNFIIISKCKIDKYNEPCHNVQYVTYQESQYPYCTRNTENGEDCLTSQKATDFHATITNTSTVEQKGVIYGGLRRGGPWAHVWPTWYKVPLSATTQGCLGGTSYWRVIRSELKCLVNSDCHQSND